MLVGYAQHTVRLNLAKTLELAKESSLAAFRYKNMYLSGYWEYRTYKASSNVLARFSLTVCCA